MIIILSILVLIFSAIIHEYAHGWMAKQLGDDTAERAGRLTLNPIKHLDPIGSVLLPILLVVTNASFFFAWAKPVPYNPNNLRDRRYGDLKVALAGPGVNIILAIIFGSFVRLVPVASQVKITLVSAFFQGNTALISSLTHNSLAVSLCLIAMVICFINLALAIFNLIPVPPLDGSKVVYTFLSGKGREIFYKFEQYGFIILIALIMLGAFNFAGSVVFWFFALLTGIL
jgi:Zn-dependent protease